MKFGKLVDELRKDGCEEVSVRYKKLKKQIKSLPVSQSYLACTHPGHALPPPLGDGTTAAPSANKEGSGAQDAATTPHPAGVTASGAQQFNVQGMPAVSLSSNPPPVSPDGTATHSQPTIAAPQQPASAASQHLHGLSIPSSPEEDEFIATLSEDLGTLNVHFMDEEEDAVIKLHELSQALGSASTMEQLQPIKGRLVKLHGEMVLLLHWSFLNFAAVTKILKKHDKHTGLQLKDQFLVHTLQQPFASTSIVSSLVHRVETLVAEAVDSMDRRNQHLGKQTGQQVEQGTSSSAQQEQQQQREQHLAGSSSSHAGPPVATHNRLVDEQMYGRTMSALDTWASMSRNAVTPSTVLPMHIPAQDTRRCSPQPPLQTLETANPVRGL